MSLAPPRAAGDLRAEVAGIMRLASPIILVQLGMMSMGTIDSMMLGRVSELALASGALGASLSFGMMIFPIGVLMALDPLIAQAHGAGDTHGVGLHLRDGLVLALFLSLPLAALMWDTRGLLRLFGQQPAVVAAASDYIRSLVPGVAAFLLYATIRRAIQAMSILRPAVLAIIVANLANVLGNYTLIYGHWGAPALGVVGSGIATSIARWVMLVTMLAAARSTVGPYLASAWRSPYHLRSLLRPLRIGVPIGVQSSLEMWMFMAVALMMGSLGARQLAAHQISLNLAAIAFMLPLGMSGAAATRVGNAIGRRDMRGARRAAAVSLVLGGGVMTVSALAFWKIPQVLSRMYTPDHEVIALAATLLPIAALFQVADGVQVVGSGVLRGAADTRAPAAIALVGFWLLGLPLAYLLAFRVGLGPRGLWWGLTIGLASVASLILVRVLCRFTGEIAAIDTERTATSS